VLHLLRCSPSASHTSLTKFDALIRGNPTHHQLRLYWHSVDTGQSASQRWRPWDKKCVFACTSRFFGISCKHTPSKTTSWTNVSSQTVTFYSLICRNGLPNLVKFRILYPPSSHSGTVLVCSRRRPWWKPAWRLHIIGRAFWPLPHNTAVIGYSFCLLPPAVLNWMMRRCEWQ